MERVVLKRFQWIFEDRNILPLELTGFRQGHGTADSVADLISSIEHSEKRGLHTLTVSHSMILGKLHELDVGGQAFPLYNFFP